MEGGKRLVLLKKAGNPENEPSSYRPQCLLDTLGKLLDHLLLGKAKGRPGDNRQKDVSLQSYGFLEGRSTVDAIREETIHADEAVRGK